ncbi:DUF1295 domain-containing protein [Gemmatimonadota bacterium]
MFSAYLPAVVTAVSFMTVIFLAALIIRDNSIVDIAWGIGFVLIAIVTRMSGGEPATLSTIVTVLVTLWGLRLALYIAVRKKGEGEDFRYAKWRRGWGRWFVLRSFFQIFMLQGALMLVIAMPIVHVNAGSGFEPGLIGIVGIVVWMIGFLFETVGDWQLFRFKQDPANRGRVMDRGLWRYTRHPNYFGESVLWWGIFLLALGTPGGWMTVIGPALITLLLLRVSGVTMLERALVERREGYHGYIERTNAFIPWIPKVSSNGESDGE